MTAPNLENMTDEELEQLMATGGKSVEDMTDDELDSLMSKSVEDMTDEQLDALLAQQEDLTPPGDDADESTGFSAFAEGAGDMALLGYLPHLSAMTEPAMDRIGNAVRSAMGKEPVDEAPWSQMNPGSPEYLQARDANISAIKQRAEESPTASMAGKVTGLATTALLPIGAAKTATTVGKAALRGGLTGAAMGAAANPGDEFDVVDPMQVGDRLVNAAIGGTVGAAVPAAIGLGKATFGAGKYLAELPTPPKGAGSLDEVVEVGGELSRPDVMAAADRLKIPTTPAMRTEDWAVRGMEQSLAVSPSAGGALVRRAQTDVRNGILSVVDDVFSSRSERSSAQMGEAIVETMKNKLIERMKPLQRAYSEIFDEASGVAIKQKHQKALSDSLMKYADDAFAPGTVQQATVKKFAFDLANAKNVDQLKQIRTNLRRQIKSIDPAVRYGFEPIFDKIDRLERSSLLKAAIEKLGKEQGLKEASELIKKTKATNRSYRELMQLVSSLGERGKISRSRTMTEFLDDLDDLPTEVVGEKLFRMKDQRLLNIIKEEMPEVFELLRTQKVNELVKKATDPNGNLSAKRLLNLMEKAEPEVKAMILGDKSGKYKDLLTVARSLPGPINPSGTSINQSFWNTVNPFVQVPEIIRYGMLRTGMVPGSEKMLNFAMNSSDRFGGVAAIPAATGSLTRGTTIEGYKEEDLVNVLPEEIEAYRAEVEQGPYSSIERAKRLKLLNQHGLRPIQ